MKRYLPIVAVAALVSLFTSGAVQTLFSAFADQSERVPPTSGIFTGPQYSQKLGDAFRSVSTGNKGNSAPANVGGSAVDGLEWIDDSATPWIKKRWVNGGWAVEGALDPTDSSYIGVIGGGIASIASGTTVDLGSVPQANVTITGTTTVTGFGSAAPAGIEKTIRFDNALKLTNSSSLTIPGGFDLTTAANDRAKVTHLGSGNWEITTYTRASGIPVDISKVGKPSFDFSGSVSSLEVIATGQALTRTSYPAYLSKVTRVQNGTRTSGNATITSVADTSAFGVGMPVESTGVNSGCTIASFVANTSITLNSSSCVTASGTSTVTVFLTGYGSGGSSTTVGVPNCGGAVLAGRESSPSRLTATYAGGDSSVMAKFFGSENVSMALGNLIAHTHSNTLTDPGHTHGIKVGSSGGGVDHVTQGDFGGSSIAAGGPTGPVQSTTTGVAISNASAGSASPTPMRTVQPTLIAECVVRVIP